jgi:hypothetical protein
MLHGIHDSSEKQEKSHMRWAYMFGIDRKE